MKIYYKLNFVLEGLLKFILIMYKNFLENCLNVIIFYIGVYNDGKFEIF